MGKTTETLLEISGTEKTTPPRKKLGVEAYFRGWGNGDSDIHKDPTREITGPAGKYNSLHQFLSPKRRRF